MTVKIYHNEVTKVVLVFFSCASLPLFSSIVEVSQLA